MKFSAGIPKPPRRDVSPFRMRLSLKRKSPEPATGLIVAKQVEHWARLGQAAESILSGKDIYRLVGISRKVGVDGRIILPFDS